MQASNFGETKQELMARLEAEHRALKARVQELESHLSLSPSEQLELARLKKLKLQTKDQLYALRRN